MRIHDALKSSIGAPCVIRQFSRGKRYRASIARWRHDGASFDLSTVNTVQLIFNVSGGQLVELRSGECRTERRIRAGSIAVTSPGSPDSVAVKGKADILQISIGHEASRDGPICIPPQFLQNDSRLQACGAQALVALTRRQDADNTELRAIVDQVARLFLSSAASPAPHARGGLSPTARQRVRALIDTRLEEAPWASPSLSELADAARLSLYHFARAFRETQGQTPHAYVLARRIDHAVALLLRSYGPIDQVGEMSGFASTSHFVSAFRKHVGVTPGALRDAAYTPQ